MKVKLVLGGSGTLYPVHLGAIIKLAEAGYEIEEVCASSVSAIVAAAVASGYKLNEEVVKVAKEGLFAKHKLPKQSYFTLWRRWGLQRTKKLETVLSKYFVARLGETKIPLSLVSYNVSKGEHVVFSSKQNPEMLLSKALCAAISTPILFEPAKIDGELYVDSAISADFPFDIFGNGSEVICIRPYTNKAPSVKSVDNKTYLASMLEQMIRSSLVTRIPGKLAKQTVLIGSKYECLDFNITDAEVDGMVAEGYRALGEWLTEVRHGEENQGSFEWVRN